MLSAPRQENLRKDIQALRAIAVGAVLIFHIWPSALPGGFVGVDIFFVISGYLITGQLWRQVQRDGRVNFRDFWARRARRLLPASLLVIALTSLALFVVVPKSEFERFFKDAVASTFYVANWFFIAKSTNYLEDTAPPSAFQHFWSLSVEEQYYIIWPILLLVVLLITKLLKANLNRMVVFALAALLIFSLVCSVWLTEVDAAQAYFSTVTRAWEFAAGALLAVMALKKRGDKTLALAYCVGLALVVAALFTFTEATPFPSFWAAIPVLGTTLMLWGGESKKLWRKPIDFVGVQFIGDISYSLYLWHWPVLILTPWILPGPLDLPMALLIISVSVLLAWLSKKLVEDPVRFGRLSQQSPIRQIAVTAVLMLLVASGAAVLNQAKAPRPASTNPEQKVYEVVRPTNKYKHPGCLVAKIGSGFKTCSGGDANGEVAVALIGDSHTRQYWSVVENLAVEKGWKLTLISKSACPLQDYKSYAATIAHPTCKEWNKQLGEYLATAPKFDLVINSNASYYTAGDKAVSESYRKLVSTLVGQGTRWMIIKDNPKPLKHIEACLYAAKARAAEACKVDRSSALKPVDELPDAVSDLPGVIVVDPTNILCDSVCKPVIDDKLMYRDYSHISWSAATKILPLIEAAIPAEFK